MKKMTGIDWNIVVSQQFRAPQAIVVYEDRAVFKVDGVKGKKRDPHYVKLIQSNNLPKEVEYIMKYSQGGISLPLRQVQRIVKNGNTWYAIQLEPAAGTLDDFILNYPGQYSAGVAISKHLMRLEEDRVVHRDIKTSNLFLTNPTRPQFYLGDFGATITCEEYQRKMKRSNRYVGTQGYIPPEEYMFPRYDCDENEIPVVRDTFSFGMVLFSIVMEQSPHLIFSGSSRDWGWFMTTGRYHDEISEILPPPRVLPPHFKEVIEACIEYNPFDRPTMKEIHERLIS